MVASDFVGILTPSTADTVALVDAVRERIVAVAALYQRERGIPLSFPHSLRSDVARWKAIMARHRVGDFRNTEAELKSVKAIGQFAVDMKMAMCGQAPKKVEWR